MAEVTSTLTKMLKEAKSNGVGKPKRSKFKIENDRTQITELYLRQVPQHEIAKQLSLSQSTVSREISRIIEGWQAANYDQINAFRAMELEKINLMEREMLTAWEASKQVIKRTNIYFENGKINQGGQGNKPTFRQEQGVEEITQGNMEYFRGWQWCIEQRAKILGLYAPKKVAQTDPTGNKEAGTSAVDDVMRMIKEANERKEKSLQQLEQPKHLEAGKDFVDGEIIEDTQFTAEETLQGTPLNIMEHEPKVDVLGKSQEFLRTTNISLDLSREIDKINSGR